MKIPPSASSSFPRPTTSGEATRPPHRDGPPVVDGQVLDRRAPTRGAVVDLGGGVFFMGEVVGRALQALGKSLMARAGSSPIASEASEDPLDDARMRLRELDRQAVQRAVTEGEERGAGPSSAFLLRGGR